MMTKQGKNAVVCSHCQHENRAGALICSRCHRLMVAPGGSNGTVQLNEADMAAVEAQATVTTSRAVADGRIQEVRLRVTGYDHVLAAPLHTGTLMLGREDASRAIYPDIDLSPFEASKNGISRCHAILRREDDALYVQDLNSSNGTFINERPISPNEPHRLYHGDVLRLGKLRLELALR